MIDYNRDEENGTQETLDRVTRLAGELLDAPVACVWMVDSRHRLMMSGSGMSAPIAMLQSYPFCRHMTASGHGLAVNDGRADPALANSAAVRDGTVMAYAGMPLMNARGRAVGTLFVTDRKPREWSATQLSALDELSSLISIEAA